MRTWLFLGFSLAGWAGFWEDGSEGIERTRPDLAGVFFEVDAGWLALLAGGLVAVELALLAGFLGVAWLALPAGFLALVGLALLATLPRV